MRCGWWLLLPRIDERSGRKPAADRPLGEMPWLLMGGGELGRGIDAPNAQRQARNSPSPCLSRNRSFLAGERNGCAQRPTHSTQFPLTLPLPLSALNPPYRSARERTRERNGCGQHQLTANAFLNRQRIGRTG